MQYALGGRLYLPFISNKKDSKYKELIFVKAINVLLINNILDLHWKGL